MQYKLIRAKLDLKQAAFTAPDPASTAYEELDIDLLDTLFPEDDETAGEWSSTTWLLVSPGGPGAELDDMAPRPGVAIATPTETLR